MFICGDAPLILFGVSFFSSLASLLLGRARFATSIHLVFATPLLDMVAYVYERYWCGMHGMHSVGTCCMSAYLFISGFCFRRECGHVNKYYRARFEDRCWAYALISILHLLPLPRDQSLVMDSSHYGESRQVAVTQYAAGCIAKWFRKHRWHKLECNLSRPVSWQYQTDCRWPSKSMNLRVKHLCQRLDKYILASLKFTVVMP